MVTGALSPVGADVGAPRVAYTLTLCPSSAVTNAARASVGTHKTSCRADLQNELIR
jgi:hypothetical protein